MHKKKDVQDFVDEERDAAHSSTNWLVGHCGRSRKALPHSHHWCRSVLRELSAYLGACCIWKAWFGHNTPVGRMIPLTLPIYGRGGVIEGKSRYPKKAEERLCIVILGTCCSFSTYGAIGRDISFEPRPIASLYQPVKYPLARRDTDVSEVLRYCLFKAGEKDEEIPMAGDLPTVMVTAESCALPLQAQIVVG